MSLDAEALYRLLPAVHRLRDQAEGEPLRALLALIAQEFQALEENIEQLYDDQFIETCAEWVTPYIGDLVGYRSLHAVAPQVASSRREVANAIRHRRRKGTALMLEQLAFDVTGWHARATEFFEQLVTTQYMNHLRPHALATAAVRSQAIMIGRGSAFNRVAHTAEVRRPQTGSGRYNIPNIGLFLWRLQPYRLDSQPLTPDPEDASGRRFRVNPLGADLQLFRRPHTEALIDHLAEPINVPAPLSIRELALQVRAATATDEAVATSDDYGAGRSVVISRAGVDEPLRLPGAPPPDDPDERLVVRVADLRDVFDGGGSFVGWAHEDDIAPEQIGVDPERGRVLLGSDRVADHAESAFVATFHYGFARPIGAGQYERTPADVDPAALQRTAANAEPLQPALDEIAAGGRLLIGDSLTYAQTPTLRVADPTAADERGNTVVLAASNGARPLLAVSADLVLDIGVRGTLILDGLVLAGGRLVVPDAGDSEPRTLVLRDCTLVPGITLLPDGSAASPGEPSLVISHPFTTVRLERCITGALHTIAQADVTAELVDCIVDAGAPENIAYAADADGDAGAEITLRECTVIGKLHTQLLRLASNTIFFARLAPANAPPIAPVRVQRRQEGCMRFSYVPSGSITPRRHRCQPDADHPDVLPHFTSLRYGAAGYCQLRAATSLAIRAGADDESEMGVMHALFQPQREANLRIRLDEYLRYGLQAGLFYAT